MGGGERLEGVVHLDRKLACKWQRQFTLAVEGCTSSLRHVEKGLDGKDVLEARAERVDTRLPSRLWLNRLRLQTWFN